MFKRKKSSINVAQQQPSPTPQQPTVTPLYERFATKAATAPTSFSSALSASTNSVNYNGSAVGGEVSNSRPMTLGKPAPGVPVVPGRTRLASLQAQKSTQELYQDTFARILSSSKRREKAIPPSQQQQQQHAY